MSRTIIDYLSFSVRVDGKSLIRFNDTLNLDYMSRLMGIPSSEFSNCGKVKYYKERYEHNDISIAVPYDRSEATQGYHVTMRGMGCRFFESNLMQGEQIDSLDIWRNFFMTVRNLTTLGLAVNISRIDIANDDYSGVLNLDNIISCIERDTVGSRFQRQTIPVGKTDIYVVGETLTTMNFYKRIRGKTVVFGSRLSNVLCRFYDKKAEQMQRHYMDKKALAALEMIPHWVRMEFEFHDENAIKIVNSICDEADFPHFFSCYVNGMIRFVHRDDSNMSRCTTQGWWRKFLGTLSRTKLSVGEYKPLSRQRHLDYVYKHLSGMIYTAMDIDGVDTFLNNIISNVNIKGLKSKHQLLCAGIENKLQDMCSAELWDALKPAPYDPIPKASRKNDYWYSEKPKPQPFQSTGKYSGTQVNFKELFA